jgi:hypothetical protein
MNEFDDNQKKAFSYLKILINYDLNKNNLNIDFNEIFLNNYYNKNKKNI